MAFLFEKKTAMCIQYVDNRLFLYACVRFLAREDGHFLLPADDGGRKDANHAD